MNAEDLKSELKELFGDNVIFNEEFDYYTEDIKNVSMILLDWCKLIKERKVPPISKSILKDQVVFIRKIGSSNRCIIIKIKNGEFKEIHLADHAYYDKKMKELGLKRSSKRY
jgi:hypothetical protein